MVLSVSHLPRAWNGEGPRHAAALYSLASTGVGGARALSVGFSPHRARSLRGARAPLATRASVAGPLFKHERPRTGGGSKEGPSSIEMNMDTQ